MSSPKTMLAITISPSPPNEPPYSSSNPAPSSALTLTTLPIPTPQPGTLLIRNRASSIIRDTLTWPEMYTTPEQIPGNDFAGTVVAAHEADAMDPDDVNPSKPAFQVGTEVFGMTHASRGQTWAEYVLVRTDECALKPKSLGWAEAAAAPLSALTAWQALFEHAGLARPDFSVERDGDRVEKSGKAAGTKGKRVLVTGAAGGVGAYIVQLASWAGHVVVCATRSSARNEEFLWSLGAGEVVEYTALPRALSKFDIILDTVGGYVLETCWSVVSSTGKIVTVDSASSEFPNTHHEKGLSKGKEHVRAEFFIVKPSTTDLGQISMAFDMGLLRVFVAETVPMEDVKAAYDRAQGEGVGRGKIVVIMGWR